MNNLCFFFLSDKGSKGTWELFVLNYSDCIRTWRGMDGETFFPPVVALWEQVGSHLDQKGVIDTAVLLDAVEKLLPITTSLGSVFSVRPPLRAGLYCDWG